MQLNKDDITAANNSTDRIIIDYADNNELPGVLSVMADVYSWNNMHDKAQQLYGIVADKSPNSPLAAKARLCIARTKVMQLMDGDNYPLAAQQINSLTSDFSGNPDLPETLYRIADRYKWAGKSEEAKGIYQLIQTQPANSYTDNVKLGIARADAMSLIMAKDYDGAQKTIDKLVVDFSAHLDLPEALYLIAERYEWLNQFQDAKGVYQRIIQNSPGSPYASKSKLRIAKANIMYLVYSKEYDAVEDALNKKVQEMLDKACERAKANGRRTLHARDL